MKLLTIVTLLCLTALRAFYQEENVIKFKSEVTLTLTKAENGNYNYKITEAKDFDKILDENNGLLKNKLDTNQIKLVFCFGKFGGGVKTLLVIKSGLNVFLKYKAQIKRAQSNNFEKTSVEPLFPKVQSIEEWPYDISEIILSDFAVMKSER